MANKKPWKIEPNVGVRQAHVHVDESGTAWIRQSLRTEDGRILWFDMSPKECASLLADLESARMDVISGLWSSNVDAEYPEERF